MGTTALVVDGTVVPMELGHLSIGGRTFEEDLGIAGLKRLGRKKWQKRVEAVLKRLVPALLLDEAVLGGGNARKLTRLPMGCRMGDNANAFLGGFRLWEGHTN
jgi:polyphosphate glucokinase